MPELILPKAIRGLANAFGFPGSRTGPRGVDLSIDPQTVVDLSAFGRFGASRIEVNDGWEFLAISSVGAGIGIVNGAFSVNRTNLASFRDGDVLWIFSVACSAFATVAMADLKQASLHVVYPVTVGPGAGSAHPIHATNYPADGFDTAAATNANLMSAYTPALPFPVVDGSSLVMNQENSAAAGAVTVTWTLLVRILPPGVYPL